MTGVSAKELAIRGCVERYGVERPVIKQGQHERGGSDAAKAVAQDPTTVRFSRRVCVRPYGHDGAHRGPRLNIMRPTAEVWQRATAGAGKATS